MFYCRTLLSSLALLFLASSCRLFRPVNPNGGTDVQPMADTMVVREAIPAAVVSPDPRPVDVSSLNDASVAAVVLASNNTDISYARLVPSRGERTDVKEFAKHMLTDHTAINGLLTELLTKLDLTPEDNSLSLDLRDESSSRRDHMRELSGYQFDSTYIENEVSYHRRFLYSIDNVLSPRARNADLRTLLSTVRPAIAAHLAHAEQVRANVLTRK